MRGRIYLIRNLINGKGYVGQTIQTIPQRFLQHKSYAKRGNGCLLGKAFRKYGFDNFSIQEIVASEVFLLNDLERHYIEFYGTFNRIGHGYNMTLGGDGAAGHFVSAETRAKQSVAKIGKPAPNKGKPSPMRGKKRGPLSEESKRNRPKSKRQYVSMSKEMKAKLLLINTGRVCLPETRIKIGKANSIKLKGKPWSEARIKAAQLGH